MDLITYETIRAAHRAEKEQVLQKLPDNFFQAVKTWFAQKENQKDTISLLEVENAKKLLEDIVNMREKKIVLAALRTVRGELPPQVLTDVEKTFFDKIVNLLKNFREEMSEQLISYSDIVQDKIEDVKKSLNELKKEEKIEIKPNGKLLVKVLIEVPRFVGTDMQTYGPLKPGDVISLPTEIANVLITRKVAENLLE